MNRSFSIAVLASLAVAAIALLLQHEALKKLRIERSALETRLAQTNRLTAENERLAKQLIQSRPISFPAHAPASEIERLLRQVATQKSEINRLQNQIGNVPEIPGMESVPFSFLTISVPKNEWCFAGYNSPEAAVQSMLWGTLNKDVQTIRSSLTPDEQSRRLKKEWNGKNDSEIGEDGARRLENATGFQILKQQTSAADSIHYTVLVDGLPHPEQPLWLDVKKIGNEWKCDGPMYHRD